MKIHWPTIALCAALLGCQTRLEIAVFNNLNERVLASVGSDTETIEPGKSAELRYPDPDGTEQGLLRITIGNCTLSYKTPASLDEYPWQTELRTADSLPLQLEADFKIYAVPPGSVRPVLIPSITPFQKDGFPLSPLAKECH